MIKIKIIPFYFGKPLMWNYGIELLLIKINPK